MAHCESEISPPNTDLRVVPVAKAAESIKNKAPLSDFTLLLLGLVYRRGYEKTKTHALVRVTANYGANSSVATWLRGCSHCKVLHSGLQKEPPAGNRVGVLIEQCQTVYAAVSRNFHGTNCSDA